MNADCSMVRSVANRNEPVWEMNTFGTIRSGIPWVFHPDNDRLVMQHSNSPGAIRVHLRHPR